MSEIMQTISIKWKQATAYLLISIKKLVLIILLAIGITLWGKIAILTALRLYIFLPLLKVALRIIISIAVIVTFLYLAFSLR
ncbi:MAG: hypothetical protein ACK5MI_03125 [Mangrovibacterium sp.]